jgi:hypothetical protein
MKKSRDQKNSAIFTGPAIEFLPELAIYLFRVISPRYIAALSFAFAQIPQNVFSLQVI